MRRRGISGKPGRIKNIARSAQALQLLAPHFRLVVVTNQSGIAKGMFSENDLLAVHQEVAKRLAEEQAVIEAYYYCPRHRYGAVPEYT